MKKVLCLISVLALAACQAPYEKNVFQAVGPRVCVEYYDSFRCSAPTRTWHETVYPKNEAQMEYGYYEYRPYQPTSFNRSVYGTYGY